MNLRQIIRSNVYQLKRQYGICITVNDRIAGTSDITTGVKAESTRSITIRRAIKLPDRYILNPAFFAPVMKDKNTPAIYSKFTDFIVDAADLQGIIPTKKTWITSDSTRYNIKEVNIVGENVAYLIRTVSVEGETNG